uniref:Uncharacterized protein n=1 Tax=Ditylum brightwellii TaxID=49249 RepID=A0A7S1Z6U0_9STRA
MLTEKHRFLLQNEYGNYVLMPAGSAKELTRRQLIKASDGLVKILDETISSILARSRFGEFRHTDLAKSHVPNTLNHWRKLLFSQRQQQQSQQMPSYLIPISEEPMELVHTPVVRGRSKIQTSKNTISSGMMSLGQSLFFPISKRACPSSWYTDLSINQGQYLDALDRMNYKIGREVEVFPGNLFNQWYIGHIGGKNRKGTEYTVFTAFEHYHEIPRVNLRPVGFQEMIMKQKDQELNRKLKMFSSSSLRVQQQSNMEHVVFHSTGGGGCCSSSRQCDKLSGCSALRSFPKQYEPHYGFDVDGILVAFY